MNTAMYNVAYDEEAVQVSMKMSETAALIFWKGDSGEPAPLVLKCEVLDMDHYQMDSRVHDSSLLRYFHAEGVGTRFTIVLPQDLRWPVSQVLLPVVYISWT